MIQKITKVLFAAITAMVFLTSCQNPLQGSYNPPSKVESRTVISGTTRIEAEAYTLMSGVQLETCSEGGQDVGYIDAGDWMVYPITVNTAGSYKISYRIATADVGKQLSADINAGATVLGTVALPNTGDWQNWQTVSQTVNLPAGTYNLGINGSTTGGFNLNWIEIVSTSTSVTPGTNPGATDGKPYFMIVNKYSGKALDLIAGDSANGARINQWSYDYNGPNQRWAILPTENADHFKLVSWVSGKAACIDLDSLDNGAQLHDWDYTGNNPGQQFDLIDVGNGWFKIKNVKSGKLLEVSNFDTANDAKVQQWTDANGDNQIWRLQPWGDYFIRAVGGRYICVANMGSSDGSRIIQYDGQNNPWFKWNFQNTNDGWYGVHSLNATSKVLCVAGPSTAAAAYTHLWEYNPNNIGDQKVRILPMTDGSFKFYFNFTGMAWDIPGGQTANNVELDQYPDNANANQRFRMLRTLDLSNPVTVSITTQPVSQKATPASTATFWVAASASSGISYQWYKNGSAISGATSPIYITPLIGTGDANASFYVNVSSGGSTVSSNSVSLTINHDIDDLLSRAGGKSWTSTTPMGNHYQNRHVTTDSDRSWLLTASNEPPPPPGLVSSLHLAYFGVNLYPSGNPTPADINQHNIGDCNGITALANLAYMVPNFVKSIITDRGSGVFDVAMFDPQGQKVTVRVDSQFLADSSGRIVCVTGKNDVACWSAVLEKAIMKYNVIYQVDTTIEGIGAENVIAPFVGVGNSFAYDRGALSPAELTRVIKTSLTCGKLISGGFGAQITLGNVYSVPAHGYECFWPADGTMIAMRNPWGVNPIINGGGYDSSLDGILNIPATTTWSQTIDLRIADPGIAGSAGRTTVYVPGVAASGARSLSASSSVHLSPEVANPK